MIDTLTNLLLDATESLLEARAACLGRAIADDVQVALETVQKVLERLQAGHQE